MRLEEERVEAGRLRGVVPRKCARVMAVLAKAVAVVCAADREERADASVEVPMDHSSEGPGRTWRRTTAVRRRRSGTVEKGKRVREVRRR